MASKTICVVEPKKRVWFSKKYYSKEFPRDLIIFNFPESKYTAMIDDLNRGIIYDIGPVGCVAYIVFWMVSALLSVLGLHKIEIADLHYFVGVPITVCFLWFVLKQVSDTRLNSVLLDTSTEEFTFTLDWFGRITVYKVIHL
jgi:cytosine/uracil/thiamine/allantoin permease